MAVVQNFNPDDPQNNQQQNQQGNQASAQPVALSGGSSSPMSNTGSAAAPTIQSSSSPTKSGSYTNLKSYIDANKNYNQQGGGFGGQIYSDLDKKQQGIQTNFQGAQDQFKNQANQGRVQYDQNVVNQAFADPTQFTNNQDNLNAFTKLRDATYGGPTQLAQAQDFQNQATGFQGLTQQTQSEQGRYGLLNNLYGNQKYNQGQQQLDNLFLQADPTQLSKLQTSTQLGQNLGSTINQGLAQNQQLVQGYQNEADSARRATQEALANQILGFNKQAENQAAAYNSQAEQQYNDIRDQLSHNQLSNSMLQSLGLTSGQQLYGVDPTQYLQKTGGNATAQSSLTADQYNKINALAKLSGGVLGGQASDVLNSFTNAGSQVGKAASQKVYDFNRNQFLADIASKQNAYNAGIQQISNNAFNQQHEATKASLQKDSGWLGMQLAQQEQAKQAALANLAQQYGIGGYLQGV